MLNEGADPRAIDETFNPLTFDAARTKHFDIYEELYTAQWRKCPPYLVDLDTDGRKILRLPRVFGYLFRVDFTELTKVQLTKLGAHVSAEVTPRGKCRVADVPQPINRYEPDQFKELVSAIWTFVRDDYDEGSPLFPLIKDDQSPGGSP